MGMGLMSEIRAFLTIMLLLVLGVWVSDPGQRDLHTSTINWTDVRQTIDGFGGSSADFLDSLTPAQADCRT
jgi:hypothetical protein